MKNIGIIGTGSWGTTISTIISQNILNNNDNKLFNNEILLWGVNEPFNSTSLTNYINKYHKNDKYLKGINLNPSIIATSDYKPFTNIDILIIALPHEYISTILKFKPYIKPNIIVISVIKGLIEYENHFELISDYLNFNLKCQTNVMMGANIAIDVAKGIKNDILYKSETTIGYSSESFKDILYLLFNNNKYFNVTLIDNIKCIELCGTLKNVIALGYGVIEGLNCSNNTKVMYLRKGILEMKRFIYRYYERISNKDNEDKDIEDMSDKHNENTSNKHNDTSNCTSNTSNFTSNCISKDNDNTNCTSNDNNTSNCTSKDNKHNNTCNDNITCKIDKVFFESCGISDLIVSCTTGRNYKYGLAKTVENISLKDFEEQIGNQKVQGMGTTKCIYNYLKNENVLNEFKIIESIYQIFFEDEKMFTILNCF